MQDIEDIGDYYIVTRRGDYIVTMVVCGRTTTASSVGIHRDDPARHTCRGRGQGMIPPDTHVVTEDTQTDNLSAARYPSPLRG